MIVKIYIENLQKSPRKCNGTYGYVLACEIRGELRTKEGFGMMEGTRNQIELTACVKALERVHKPSEIQIIGSLEWIAGQCRNLSVWAENGWRTSSGKQVKNMELWQQLLKYFQKHEITFLHSKHHMFSDWIRAQIEKGDIQSVES